jgi:hypothetical protein
MRNMKCIIAGNNWSHCHTGKSLKKNLKAVIGNLSIDSLQKTATPGT